MSICPSLAGVPEADLPLCQHQATPPSANGDPLSAGRDGRMKADPSVIETILGIADSRWNEMQVL
jgi:hypothetical protein